LSNHLRLLEEGYAATDASLEVPIGVVESYGSVVNDGMANMGEEQAV